jgi:hypothetical protein
MCGSLAIAMKRSEPGDESHLFLSVILKIAISNPGMVRRVVAKGEMFVGYVPGDSRLCENDKPIWE